MATRPLVPTFAFGDNSLTNLQNLSASVGFVGTTAIGWRLYKTGDQTLSAGVTAQVTFGQSAFGNDINISGGAAKVNTRGYYDCECSLPYTNTGAAGASARAWFLITTGSNNPLGSGVTVVFGKLSDLTTGNADEMSFTFFGTTPVCLYPGDTVQVQANVGGSNVTISASWYATGNNDLGGTPDGGAQFTGTWISEGP